MTQYSEHNTQKPFTPITGDGSMQRRIDNGLCPKCATAWHEDETTCPVCSLTIMPSAMPEKMTWQEAVTIMEGVVSDYVHLMQSDDNSWPEKIIEAWKRIQKG